MNDKRDSYKIITNLIASNNKNIDKINKHIDDSLNFLKNNSNDEYMSNDWKLDRVEDLRIYMMIKDKLKNFKSELEVLRIIAR